jgi:hypothetical protein
MGAGGLVTQIDTRPDQHLAIRPKRWPLALASVVMIAGITPGIVLVGSDPGRVISITGDPEVYRGDVMTDLNKKYDEQIELAPRPSDDTAWDTIAEIEDETDVYISGEIRNDCRVDDARRDPVLVCSKDPLPTESTS